MSVINYRANLSAKTIPYLTDFQGRTVIVPGPDNTFNRTVVSGEDSDRDAGIPVAYYAHNVLPASYGFSSVGYEELIPAVVSASGQFSSVELIRSNKIAGENGPRYYHSQVNPFTAYVLGIGDVAWVPSLTAVGPTTLDTGISYATVQGITYIFYSGIGCYKYDSVTNTHLPVTLSGLTVANIIGVAAYQGYLIAYDDSTLYWSSTLDIDYTIDTVDFVPSLATGAGSLTLEGARGPITIVVPATFGLAVYTTANIVSAVYSGNSRFPFNFREIISSGGCSSADLIAYDSNTGNQYAYTTSGLQTLTATATQTVFPDLTDFLAGEDFEDFDEGTLTFTETVLSTPMAKKLTSIADRYLVFSYGITSLTHAIVYDMAQKRFGKLKIPHVDCFEYEYLSPSLADSPRKSIAFLQSDGTIKNLNPSVTYGASAGVIVLGKFQYVRSRTLTLEEIILQNVHENQSCSVYDLYSVSGGAVESQARVQGYDKSVAGDSQKVHRFHKTAMNHSICLVGGFYLSSLQLEFHVHGGR